MSGGRTAGLLGPLSGVRLLGDVVRHREVLAHLVAQNVRLRYRETILGFAWLIVRPLLPVALMSLVVGVFFEAESQDVPYPLYALVGMSIWHLMDLSLYFATRSLRRFRDGRGPYFSKFVFVVASAGPAIVEFLIYVVAILALGLYLWVANGRSYLVMSATTPLALAMLPMALGLSWALGCWTSILDLVARDTRYVIRYLTQGWFFLTPVAYSSASVPADWQWLSRWNPMTVVVEGFRSALLGVPAPPAGDLVIAGAAITFLLAWGLYFFARAELHILSAA